MRNFASLVCAISAVFLLGASHPVEEGILVLHVADVSGMSISGVCLSTRGDGSSACTDQNGKARLELAPETQPGDWVALQIAAGTKGDWVMINPWDYRVIVLPFENESNNFAQIILGVHGSKAMLQSGEAIEALLENVMAKLRQERADAGVVSEEERRAVLEEQAQAFGLDTEEISQALQAWKQRASDPYEKGLAALYEQNYPEATHQLAISLSMRDQALTEAQAEVIDAALLLGQSLSSQGKFDRAAEALKRAASLREDDDAILSPLGQMLTLAGAYAEADSVLHCALRIQRQDLGPNHPEVAGTFSELADLYKKMGRFAEADSLYRRALHIQEQRPKGELVATFRVFPQSPNDDQSETVKPDSFRHPTSYLRKPRFDLDRARTLEELAELHEELGRFTEADSLYRRAFRIQRQALGPSHPEVANTLSSLALLSQAQGETSKADSLYRRALWAYEQYVETEDRALWAYEQSVGAENHLDWSSTLGNLALFHLYRHDFKKVEFYFQKSLALIERRGMREFAVTLGMARVFVYLAQLSGETSKADSVLQHVLQTQKQNLGPDHPMVASTLGHLASLSYAQDRTAEADSLLQYALLIQEQSLGPDHPDVAETLSMLAELSKETSRFAEAESLFHRALHIQEQSLGPNHPEVAETLSSLAQLYYSQDKTTKADSLMRRSLWLQEQSLGSKDPVTASLLGGLSLLARSDSKTADIETRLQRILQVQKQSLGPSHINVAITLSSLAMHSYLQSETAKADSLFQRALRIVGPQWSRRHFATAIRLSGLIMLSQDETKADEVDPLLMNMIAEIGPIYVDAATTFNSLALQYEDPSRPIKLDVLYQHALAVMEQTLGPDHPMVAIVLSGLALRSHDQGETAEAIPLLQRTLSAAEQELGEVHPVVATFLEGYAVLLRKAGRKDQARQIGIRVQEIKAEKAQGNN